MFLFPSGPDDVDFTAIWTWGLFAARMGGLLYTLPGIGGAQVSKEVIGSAALLIAICMTLSGVRAEMPSNLAEGGLMILTEIALGFVLGFVPEVLLGGIAVAGQVVSNAIGLGQANIIDPSLGSQVSVLSEIQVKVSAIVFLMLDGHHVVFRAASGVASDIGVGLFRPDVNVATVLVGRLIGSFELAVTVAGPILVTTLVTQFVLGLITKFIPQVNIFIISLPLTVFLGLFITVHTYPGVVAQVVEYFSALDEHLAQILQSVLEHLPRLPAG